MWYRFTRTSKDGYTQVIVDFLGSKKPAEPERENVTVEFVVPLHRDESAHDTGPLSGDEIWIKSFTDNKVLHTALSSLLFSSLVVNRIWHQVQW